MAAAAPHTVAITLDRRELDEALADVQHLAKQAAALQDKLSNLRLGVHLDMRGDD